MIDTHVHLQAFDKIDPILERARAGGVTGFIVPGDTLENSKFALKLAEDHRGVRSAVGVHPHEAKSVDDEVLGEIKRLALSGGVVAIGEIGLDYHYDHSPRDVQKRVFAEQLEIARELEFPVIVHNRESTDDLLAILKSSGVKRGVFHCFSGDRALAEEALALGFDISFAGTLTFKNADTLREVARWVPEDRFLIETDSPYLTPEPHRGKRNEPSYLPFIASALATVRGIDVERVAEAVRANTARIFGV
ncbi:MAG: TatD family hydrolase [Candidatus Aquicultorales bacterium]